MWLTILFAVLTLDAVVTAVLVEGYGWVELNPVWNYFIERAGIIPTMCFKIIYGFFIVEILRLLTSLSKVWTEKHVAVAVIVMYVFLYSAYVKDWRIYERFLSG